MADLLLSDRFHEAPEVLELSSRALGAWVRIACYHARYPHYDIPRPVQRMLGIRRGTINELLTRGWLVAVPDGWRLGHAETGLWAIGRTSSGRPYRSPIPPEVRQAVFARDGRACLFCGMAEDLTLDHIIPWSHGGPDTIDNLRVLCRPCNSARGNRVDTHLNG